MTGKNDVESPFKTNHVPSQDSEVDNFCMRCGGSLDDRTKQCPRCDTPSNIPEETDRIFPVQGPFHAPPPPPPPVGRKAPIPSPSQQPIFQIPPSPAAPRSSTPIPKIYIAVGIIVVVIIIALVFALGVRSGYSNHVGTPTVQVTPATTVITRPATTTDNLASQYCGQVGGTTVIKKDSTGAEYGMCTFPSGSACEEWALFRGECKI